MTKSFPRIIFMGTPEFAVPCLRAIHEAGYPVIAVITAPDRQGGRGMKLIESAVKKYATEAGLPVLQPERLKNPDFLKSLAELKADLQVVVAFRMLPELVWNMPPLGTINLHASLLPNYRGAAPINWAIINGENETGLTTFKLQHDIDTGNILLQKKIPIEPDDNAGSLHDKMMQQGAQLLVRTIDGMVAGTLHEMPQEVSADLSHAPKLTTDTCRINLDQPVLRVHNLIRGLSPYPAAFTLLEGKVLKIFKSTPEETVVSQAPGTVSTDHKTFLRFACNDGWLSVTDIQLEGKKRMPVADFLRGFRHQNS
jgi:methionyl-tRNA formyltransferase